MGLILALRFAQDRMLSASERVNLLLHFDDKLFIFIMVATSPASNQQCTGRSCQSAIAWVSQLLTVFSFLLWPVAARGQAASRQPNAPQSAQSQSWISRIREQDVSRRGEVGRARITFSWVIPNYRSDEDPTKIKPLTPGGKFKVAFDDSFDPSAFLIAGVFAGVGMAQREYAPFGQGAQAFGKYYGGAFADQAIGGKAMIRGEGLFPAALHQDPRYFVKGKGGFWKRTGYALSREFITLGDDGRNHFNTSELAGNAVAAGIFQRLLPRPCRPDHWETQQISGGATEWRSTPVFNVAKEFWPDVQQKVIRKVEAMYNEFLCCHCRGSYATWSTVAGSERVTTAPPAGPWEILAVPP